MAGPVHASDMGAGAMAVVQALMEQLVSNGTLTQSDADAVVDSAIMRLSRGSDMEDSLAALKFVFRRP